MINIKVELGLLTKKKVNKKLIKINLKAGQLLLKEIKVSKNLVKANSKSKDKQHHQRVIELLSLMNNNQKKINSKTMQHLNRRLQ